ncbi:MAG: AraC family transcriptional regulator [Steroidobacteraceae bacterium]|jgi:AraC-like DNA-binding protein
MSEWDFCSQDSDEIQEFLGGIYAENEFQFIGDSGRPSRTRIRGTDLGDIAQYDVSYSARFRFLSETERESVLILTCTAGNAHFRCGNDVIEFRAGRTAPIAATRESRVESGDTFAHISTHISSDAIQSLCSRLLGRALDAPVQFAHVPFTPALKAQWDLVIRSLSLLLATDHPSDLAINSLNEYAITLLLVGHPHNYSRLFESRNPVSAKVAREAKHFIDQNSHRNISVADVAAFASCGIRELHAGFCEHLGVTPRAYLHFSRMNWARSRLSSDAAENMAPEAAQGGGRMGLAAFESNPALPCGDNPMDAFQRYFQATCRNLERGRRPLTGVLTPSKMDLLRHHVNISLGKRITVGKLSAIVCMSPQSFAPAFKRAFKITPAQYVLRERVKWASWLLVNTDSSIAEVAAQTGFASQSHLTAVLKRRTGATPYGLRKSSRVP